VTAEIQLRMVLLLPPAAHVGLLQQPSGRAARVHAALGCFWG
jgi:hypothetical protein